MTVAVEQTSVTALRARAHPIRLRMLSLLTGAAMSAAELAREMDVSQALASYHLRALVDADLVVLAEERSNRGGRERRYRYDARQEERRRHPMDDDERSLLITALVAELERREPARDPAGPGLVVDAEVWVTDEQWAEIREQVAEASRRLHDLAQRPGTPGTRPVNASVVMFAMTDERAGADDGE
jgi:DNA-binding transcriptional ArsR family regulator